MQALGWRALSVANMKWFQKLAPTHTCRRNKNCKIFVGRKRKSLRWAFSLFASLSEVIAGHYKGGCYPAKNIYFLQINCNLESLTQLWFQFRNSILSLQALPIILGSLEDVQNCLFSQSRVFCCKNWVQCKILLLVSESNMRLWPPFIENIHHFLPASRSFWCNLQKKIHNPFNSLVACTISISLRAGPHSCSNLGIYVSIEYADASDMLEEHLCHLQRIQRNYFASPPKKCCTFAVVQCTMG